MGFSLGRALAGALAGGAAAAGQVADQQILEATRQREADAQLARQRQLMIEQDELLANRAERVEATKLARSKAEREAISGEFKSHRADLRAQGVNPDSQKGLVSLAGYLGEKGYIDYADKYRNDAINMQRNDESHQDRVDARVDRAQQAKERMAEIASRRAATNDEKVSAREKLELSKIDDTLNTFKFKSVDPRTDKEVLDDTAYNEAKILADRMHQANMPLPDINRKLMALKSQSDDFRADPANKGVNGAWALNKAIDVAEAQAADRAKAKAAPTQVPSTASGPRTLTPPPVQAPSQTPTYQPVTSSIGFDDRGNPILTDDEIAANNAATANRWGPIGKALFEGHGNR